MADRVVRIKVEATGIKDVIAEQEKIASNFKEWAGFENKIAGAFMSSMPPLVAQRDLLTQQLVDQQRAVDTLSDQLARLDKTQVGYATINKLLTDERGKLGDIKGRMDEIEARAMRIRNPLESLLRNTAASPLVDMIGKMEKFNDAASKMRAAGGLAKNLGDYMKQGGQTAGAFAGNLAGLFGGGMKAMLGNLGSGLKVLMGGFLQLGTVVLRFVPWVALIVAAIYTLQRIWVNNVGGIQTAWFQMIGRIETIWGQFQAKFDRGLRSLGPLLKIIFGPIFLNIMMLIEILGAFVNAVMDGIQPLFDAFGQLGDAIAGIFGGDTKEMANVFFAIVRGIGTVLGVIVGLPFRGLAIVIQLIALGISSAVGWFKKFGEAHPVLAQTLKFLMMMMSPIFLIIEAIKLAAKFFGGGEKKETSSESEVKRAIVKTPVNSAASPITNSNSNSSKVSNVTTNVTLHTSGDITKDGAAATANHLSGIVDYKARSMGS